MFSQAAQNVIFSDFLPESDSQPVLVENRSCTPDSGGGYFTLSESDTGSALGKESPNQDINRSETEIKNSKECDTVHDDNKNRKMKMNLISQSEMKENTRGLRVVSDNKNKLLHQKVARTILPPRPPRPSTDLPPTVPKRLPSKSQATHKPLKKVPPLQIQSPSMMKSFRKASSTEDLHNQSTIRRLSHNNGIQSKRASLTQVDIKKYNSFSSGKSSPMNEKKFPNFSKVNPSSRDTKGVKQNVTRISLQQKENEQKANISCRPRKKEATASIASESIAARAKRTSEQKLKQFCKTVCTPSSDKDTKDAGKIQTHSKTFQRYNSSSSESSTRSNGSNRYYETKKENHAPNKPVHSLIKIYDKSLKNKVSTTKESNINLQNKIINNDHQNNSKQKAQVNPVGQKAERKLSIPRLQQNTQIKTNSIDEFLRSVKKAKQKYQEMLNSDAEKTSDTSLEVKTDPTDSDLQTGCFTDVSYSGYFASKKSPEPNMSDFFAVANYNRECESDKRKENDSREEMPIQDSFSNRQKFNKSENNKIFDTILPQHLHRESTKDISRWERVFLQLEKASTTPDMAVSPENAIVSSCTAWQCLFWF